MSGYRAKCSVKERHLEMIIDSYQTEFDAVQFGPSLVSQICEQRTVHRNSIAIDCAKADII